MVRAIRQNYTLPTIPVRHKPPVAPPIPGSQQVSLPPIPEPPPHSQPSPQHVGTPSAPTQKANGAYRKQTSLSCTTERKQAISNFRQAVKESKMEATALSSPKELLMKFEQLMKLLG